jgi:hypothetical protein
MRRLSRLFRKRRSADEQDAEVARHIVNAFAASQGKLPSPNVNVGFGCECGLHLTAHLRNFNPVGGMEVTCAHCGAVTFFPPDILDHNQIWPEFQSALLRTDWQERIRIVKHGKKP